MSSDTGAQHLAASTPGDRGFYWMPSLADSDEANAVRLSESSAADEACVWLRVGNLTGEHEPGEWQGEQVVAHLTAEQAWQLKEQIEWLLEHHHLGDVRPAPAAGEPQEGDR